ncbi:uncharacterized protein LOC119655894 isoform X2 [Hermetia illucens]|nr:uncharacterized protein LOC119655894 isoform X2 [Hermetia illucens]XP_037917971.1 uncharacterized protein LOC119655894 isoform X2 [Hermetia illucens]XP_037917972.1 uncharacterized protein LOC119655894 isoform X2 [Hermetia illucens]
MGAYHRVLSILAPCCRSGWFHKWCIAKFALNAGYFFKCPLCNNRDVFRARLVHKGIFVPDRDATWELEPNAFSELLVRPDSCSAENCKCPRGRSYRCYPYVLLTCNTCGSKAAHTLCMPEAVETYTCDGCSTIISNNQPESQNRSIADVPNIEDNDNNNEAENENVDVENLDEEDQDGNESVDSLLLAYVRRKDVSSNGGRESAGSTDVSGDSVLFEESKEEKKNFKDDISEEDINLIYKSVRKRKTSLIDSSSGDLSFFSKRAKGSSASIDSLFFDEINRSFHDTDNGCAKAKSDSPTICSDEVLFKSKALHPVTPTTELLADSKCIASAKTLSLKKKKSGGDLTLEVFQTFGNGQAPVDSEEKVSSFQCVDSEASPNEKEDSIIVLSDSSSDVPAQSSDLSYSPSPDTDQSTSTPSSTSTQSVSSESFSTYSSNSHRHVSRIAPLSGSSNARVTRLRNRAKSMYADCPDKGVQVYRRSTRLRSKSNSNVRRSLRLRAKSTDKIYKDDLIYITELEDNEIKRKPFCSEKDILHLFVERVNCDNSLERSKFNGELIFN